MERSLSSCIMFDYFVILMLSFVDTLILVLESPFFIFASRSLIRLNLCRWEA